LGGESPPDLVKGGGRWAPPPHSAVGISSATRGELVLGCVCPQLHHDRLRVMPPRLHAQLRSRRHLQPSLALTAALLLSAAAGDGGEIREREGGRKMPQN